MNMTRSKILLGCIADDFTGATDLASNLVRGGMRVIQTMGVPAAPLMEDVDAIVIGLKTRTVPPQEAIDRSLEALHWLKAQGTDQIYFKYCSTFDSTLTGNIGPVTEALMNDLGTDFTIACPAFPENGRTVFKGYLFAGEVLLQESGMRDHPLTPMRDSNLVRVLQAQSTKRVGLIDYKAVRGGAAEVSRAIDALRKDGVAIAVVDATDNVDLMALGPALARLPFITAGSGVAIGLPQNFNIGVSDRTDQLPAVKGARAIVSGSCSSATNAQVANFRARGGAAYAIDPVRLADGEDLVGQALAWCADKLGDAPLLVYATADTTAVSAAQSRFGAQRTGELVEHALSSIARGLVERGVRELVVAGGETSGACVQALEICRLLIGQQIAPGVPWCHAQSAYAPEQGLLIALKSGNFGAVDFFTHAFEILQKTE